MPLVTIEVAESVSVEKRRAYAVAKNLEAEGVRPDDVFVVVTENTLEDWYPGARGAR